MQTVLKQSYMNSENGMYENGDSNFSAYLDSDYTIATFVQPDGFAISPDTVSCELTLHTAKSVTLDSL